jgi:hypothetical protein
MPIATKKLLHTPAGGFSIIKPFPPVLPPASGILPSGMARPRPNDTESAMTATLLESPERAAALLRDNPVNDLRHLEVTETDSEIVISGIVSSYYLKQMAQETIRPALAGRKLRNRVIVLPPK